MEDLLALDNRLVQAMDAIETLMAGDEWDFAALSRLRYQTARIVVERRPVVDALFSAALAAGGELSAAARSLRASNLNVRMQYSDYVSAWPIGRAAQDRAGFFAASQRLGILVRAQMEIERTSLYPALAKVVSSPL